MRFSIHLLMLRLFNLFTIIYWKWLLAPHQLLPTPHQYSKMTVMPFSFGGIWDILESLFEIYFQKIDFEIYFWKLFSKNISKISFWKHGYFETLFLCEILSQKINSGRFLEFSFWNVEKRRICNSNLKLWSPQTVIIHPKSL